MASSVNLGDALEAFITEAVKTGRYGSRSEVLREGVRLVQEREALWAKFEAEIGKGLDDVEAGRTIPAEEVFRELKAKYRAMADERNSKRAA
jgi:antitoxin ParD1/3/4